MNSFFVELKDLETVLVSGPDAAKFLQGQLTCDVHALAENAFTYGAACNNKGRIFAAFILARYGNDFHVLLAHGLAKIFIANLQKFIPFYKCSMQILSAQKAIGLAGTTAVSALEKCHLQIPAPGTGSAVPGMWVYNLLADNTQFILSIDETEWPLIKAGIGSDLPEASHAHWELKNILSGHFPFSLEDVDKYTPQELHFGQTGYISFSKGCYTGQEIIARMHYRGKAKKQLYLLQIEKFRSSPDHNEIEIIDDSGKTLGFAMKQITDDNQTLFAIASLPIELGSISLFTKDKQIFVYRPLITPSP
jgi:folate-binding protein YgfZ